MIDKNIIKNVVADIVGAESVNEIDENTNLYSFPDFDSIQILSLLVALDDIGVSIDQGQIAKVKTFGDLLSIIDNQ